MSETMFFYQTPYLIIAQKNGESSISFFYFSLCYSRSCNIIVIIVVGIVTTRLLSTAATSRRLFWIFVADIVTDVGIYHIPQGLDERVNINVEIVIVEPNKKRYEQVTWAQRATGRHTLPKVIKHSEEKKLSFQTFILVFAPQSKLHDFQRTAHERASVSNQSNSRHEQCPQSTRHTWHLACSLWTHSRSCALPSKRLTWPGRHFHSMRQNATQLALWPDRSVVCI